MLKAWALLLNVSNAPAKAVQSKASLVVGIKVILMCCIVNVARVVPKEQDHSAQVVSHYFGAICDAKRFHQIAIFQDANSKVFRQISGRLKRITLNNHECHVLRGAASERNDFRRWFAELALSSPTHPFNSIAKRRANPSAPSATLGNIAVMPPSAPPHSLDQGTSIR
jgi:hypothetical protein